MFDPQQLDETIYLSGVMMETNSDTLFEDLKTISKKYAKIKPQIKHLKKTCLYSGCDIKQKVIYGRYD